MAAQDADRMVGPAGLDVHSNGPSGLLHLRSQVNDDVVVQTSLPLWRRLVFLLQGPQENLCSVATDRLDGDPATWPAIACCREDKISFFFVRIK